ncbi:MAG: hypothetical protein M0T86_09225 [Betaproteobacteria bacterium]|nr:hypothetical protein [Betaproteobacteria bacterium]
MFVVRLLLALAGIALAMSLTLYFVTQDRRYLRLILDILKAGLVLFIVFGVLLGLERLV